MGPNVFLDQFPPRFEATPVELDYTPWLADRGMFGEGEYGDCREGPSFPVIHLSSKNF